MTDDERRELLAKVAAGEITPEEAAERLAAAAPGSGDGAGGAGGAGEAGGAGRTAAEEPTAGTGAVPPTEPVSDRGARRIRVEAGAGSVRVVGDPTVAVVDVDGDHEVEVEGDVYVVRGARFLESRGPLGAPGPLGEHGVFGPHGPFGDHGPFVFARGGVGGPGTATMFRVRTHRRGDRWLGELGRRLNLTVRVNPDLPLAVHVSAGSLAVRGVRAPMEIDVDAGAARLHDVGAPLTAAVRAGALSVDGRLDRGESRITCDMGTASIRLDPSSDVRITARCDLGRCDVRLGDETQSGDLTVGSGTGSLDVRGSLAAISVRVDD